MDGSITVYVIITILLLIVFQILLYNVDSKIRKYLEDRKGKKIYSLYIDGEYVKDASMSECKAIYESLEWAHSKQLEFLDKKYCHISVDQLPIER